MPPDEFSFGGCFIGKLPFKGRKTAAFSIRKIFSGTSIFSSITKGTFAIFDRLNPVIHSIMAKEKSPSRNSAKKEAVLSLKEKRAAKAAKRKTRS